MFFRVKLLSLIGNAQSRALPHDLWQFKYETQWPISHARATKAWEINKYNKSIRYEHKGEPSTKNKIDSDEKTTS